MTTEFVNDLEELGVYVPDESQLKSLEEFVNQAAALSRTIEELEEAVKRHKEELANLTHKAIPDAMSAAGTSEFKTTNGVKVTIKDVLAGSLPKDDYKLSVALKWIEENGGKSIIKSSLMADFERGEGNLEKKNMAAEALHDLGVDFIEKETVHPMTLAAFAREKLKNGDECPLEMLGLYAGRMAKITQK